MVPNAFLYGNCMGMENWTAVDSSDTLENSYKL